MPDGWGSYGTQASTEASLQEIVRRFELDSSVRYDPVLAPVVEALKGVKDITDSKEVAMAVRGLPVPEYRKVTGKPQPPKNPFAPKA